MTPLPCPGCGRPLATSANADRFRLRDPVGECQTGGRCPSARVDATVTPRDALRCAGWALRLAAWATLRQLGVAATTCTARTGAWPVTGAWGRSTSGDVLTLFGETWSMHAVREWVSAGESVFAVGDGVVWLLATAKERR